MHVCFNIHDSSNWTHDFNDGKGMVKDAYGPYFIRLEVPGCTGIGIHGTHKPESIGTRDIEGCIRLRNQELLKLKKHVSIGMVVVILPSLKDIIATTLDNSQKISENKI